MDLLHKSKAYPTLDRVTLMINCFFFLFDTLNLSDCVINFGDLSKFRHFVELDLSGTVVMDADITSILKSNTKLEGLSLNECRWITSAGIDSICRFGKNVKKLLLNKCSQLRGTVLENLSLHLCNLKQLGIAYWPHLYSKDLEHLKRIKSLEYIDLAGCMHISCLNDIIPNTSLSLLHTLILSDISEIDDKLFSKVVKHCPSLNTLNLNYSGSLSIMSLMDIPHSFPGMLHLYLAGQLHLNDMIVEEIAKFCSNLITLDVSYTGIKGTFKQRFNHLQTLLLSGCSNIQNPQIVDNLKQICPNITTIEVLNTTQLDIIKEEEEDLMQVEEEIYEIET